MDFTHKTKVKIFEMGGKHFMPQTRVEPQSASLADEGSSSAAEVPEVDGFDPADFLGEADGPYLVYALCMLYRTGRYKLNPKRKRNRHAYPGTLHNGRYFCPISIKGRPPKGCVCGTCFALLTERYNQSLVFTH